MRSFLVALFCLCTIQLLSAFSPLSVTAFGPKRLHALTKRSSCAAGPVLGLRMQMQDEAVERKAEELVASSTATAVATVDAAVEKPKKSTTTIDVSAGLKLKPKNASPPGVQVAPPRQPSESKKVDVASVRIKTEREVNFYARTALRLGLLKDSSPLLTSSMVGNKGFDPLHFAKRNDLLLQYRESELKHARLAMLASVGWAVSELLHPKLSEITGKESLLQPGANGLLEKAPSVLNGGLDKVPPGVWAGLVLLTGVVELWRMLAISSNPMNFVPGDIGFDPLNFYKAADDDEKRNLQLKEVNNGRLAMLAIAVFAAQEALGNTAVVNLAPQFFTAGPLANIGSIPELLLQYTGLLSCQSGLVYCQEGQSAIDAILKQDGGASAEYLQEILGSILI